MLRIQSFAKTETPSSSLVPAFTGGPGNPEDVYTLALATVIFIDNGLRGSVHFRYRTTGQLIKTFEGVINALQERNLTT